MHSACLLAPWGSASVLSLYCAVSNLASLFSHFLLSVLLVDPYYLSPVKLLVLAPWDLFHFYSSAVQSQKTERKCCYGAKEKTYVAQQTAQANNIFCYFH